jgi:FAD/FMN-containing dehydrogenase
MGAPDTPAGRDRTARPLRRSVGVPTLANNDRPAAICFEAGVSVRARGAGTGLAAGTLPIEPNVVLSTPTLPRL